jgi:hypothetical protein
MVASWSPPQNTKKMILYPILITELFLTHTKLELGVLGIVGKLVKDVVQLWW